MIRSVALITSLLLGVGTHAGEPQEVANGVLDAFLAAFNANEAEALADTYHYPHYRLARGTMSLLESRDDAIAWHHQSFQALPNSGWAKSTWVERRIVTASEAKIHVATRFRRMHMDGSEIGTWDSLYVLIKRDGRWGIKLRSSFL